MKESGFCASLLATRSLAEENWVWEMADALILDAIQEAAKDGANPREYVNLTCLMLVERGQEWLAVIESKRSSIQ